MFKLYQSFIEAKILSFVFYLCIGISLQNDNSTQLLNILYPNYSIDIFALNLITMWFTFDS